MSYQFQGQRASEDVVLFTRQHPFVLLHPFLIAVLFVLLPFVVYIFSSFNSFFASALLLCWLVAAWKGGLAWYSWNNSILLLTTERVVFLEQKGPLNREFSESGLRTIQQVSHEVKGALGTMYGYGNISIYTGNSLAPFLIKNIPDPYDIQQEIQQAANGEGFIDAEEE